MEILDKYSWDTKEALFSETSVDFQAMADEFIALMPAMDYDFEQTIEVSLVGFDFMETTTLNLIQNNTLFKEVPYVKRLEQKHRDNLSQRLQRASSYIDKASSFSDKLQGSQLIPDEIKNYAGEILDELDACKEQGDEMRETAWGTRIAEQYKQMREGYGIKIEGAVHVISRAYTQAARHKRNEIIKRGESACRKAPETFAANIEVAAHEFAPKEQDDQGTAVLQNVQTLGGEESQTMSPLHAGAEQASSGISMGTLKSMFSRSEENFCNDWGINNNRTASPEHLAELWVEHHTSKQSKAQLDNYIQEVNIATGGRIGWFMDEEWRYFTGNTRFPSTTASPKYPALDQAEVDRCVYVEASGGPVASCFKRLVHKAEFRGEKFSVSVVPSKEAIKACCHVS